MTEVLRVKIYQPKACYATPLSFKGIETYPLPPYSTVRGMIYNAMGRKFRKGDEMNFSIQGRYSSIYRDYWSAVKFGSQGKEKKPIEVPTLHDVELIIHIKSNILDEIEEAIRKPKVYLSLGRWDDLIRIKVDACQRITLETSNLNELFGKPLVPTHSAYIPKEKAEELGLTGIFYRLNYFYEINGDYRVFTHTKDVFYVDAPYVIEEGVIYIDRYEGEVYPVWI
jgi:CRISPR-associated protein Cas5t